MADLKNVRLIDTEDLKLYHAGVLELIEGATDTTSLHSVALDQTTHIIKFYIETSDKVTASTTPAFTVSLTDLYTMIGSMSSLSTTEKSNLVGAVNEVFGTVGDMTAVLVETEPGVKASTVVDALNRLQSEIQAGGSAGVITISTSTTTAGALKSYTFYQGDVTEANKIGVIDIPKDFVVKSGSIVKDPAGQAAGTYIALVINTKDGSGSEDVLYINVADLIDVYTAAANATQVQIAISDKNVISATIVDGAVDSAQIKASAVTEAKIASNAVTTAKVKDKQITAAKMAANSVTASVTSGVVSSSIMDATTVGLLQKAETALQASDITIATSDDIAAILNQS